MPMSSEHDATILHVDFTERKITTKGIGADVTRQFLGGLGINTWLLYRHTGPSTEPLGPENVVLLSPGLLTGTDAPTSPRVEVTTKSPLTGLIGTGNSGGHWGPSLKKAGFDTLMIIGASPSPVYILVDDEEVTLHEADHLHGMDTYETTDALKQDHGQEFSVMAVGPAGENKVRFAAPVFDKQHMPGRCHAGAVLGSKNLKAVAVRGTGEVKVRDPERFSQSVDEAERRIRSYPAWRSRAKAGSMGAIGVTETGVDYDEAATPFLRRGEPGVYCPCMMESLYGCNLVTDIMQGQ